MHLVVRLDGVDTGLMRELNALYPGLCPARVQG